MRGVSLVSGSVIFLAAAVMMRLRTPRREVLVCVYAIRHYMVSEIKSRNGLIAEVRLLSSN